MRVLGALTGSLLAVGLVSACGQPSSELTPVSSRIAFHSDRDGNPEIYVMNADGSGQTRLTDNDAREGAPGWSPDGAKIAFSSDRDGNFEIMNANGTGQTKPHRQWWLRFVPRLVGEVMPSG